MQIEQHDYGILLGVFSSRELRQKSQNKWFEKAAEEMDIELDTDQLNDLGDSREQRMQRYLGCSTTCTITMTVCSCWDRPNWLSNSLHVLQCHYS